MGFELEKNITKCYRKIRGIKKSDEREYLERPGNLGHSPGQILIIFSLGLPVSIETNCNSTNSNATNS